MTTYLQKAVDLDIRHTVRLANMTETIMQETLHTILKPHLKNRTVKFLDGNGMTDVSISHRQKGRYVINSSDIYWTYPGEMFGYTAVGNPELPDWIKEVMDLIEEYNELSDRRFAIEFDLKF